jgi:hypothetical protein
MILGAPRAGFARGVFDFALPEGAGMVTAKLSLFLPLYWCSVVRLSLTAQSIAISPALGLRVEAQLQ